MIRENCDCADADIGCIGDCTAFKKYVCTRPKGHTGSHHAHGIRKGDCFDIWDDVEVK